MHTFWNTTLHLAMLVVLTIEPALALFSTILTNHNGYTILKNFTTHTYSECYLYCWRTITCDDIQVFNDDDKKNKRYRCLFLKLQQSTTGCETANTAMSVRHNTLSLLDPKIWKKYVLIATVEKAIAKGASIYTVKRLTREYILSLDFKLTSFSNDGTNIIQLTTGQLRGEYGSRTPAIFFTHQKFTVVSAVNNYWKYGYKYISETAQEKEFQLNKWYHIQVKQIEDSKDSTQIRYSVLLDGKVLQTTINSKPSSFENVTVYLSNPWMDEQPGYVKNVYLYTIN